MNLGTQNEGNYIEPGLHDKDLRLCKFPQTNHKLPYTYLHLVMYLSTKCCSKSHFHLFAASFGLEADGLSQIVEEIRKSSRGSPNAVGLPTVLSEKALRLHDSNSECAKKCVEACSRLDPLPVAMDCRVGLRWHFRCGYPNSKPRPVLNFSSKKSGIFFLFFRKVEK